MEQIIAFVSKRAVWGSFVLMAVLYFGWQMFSSPSDANFETITVKSAPFAEQISVSGSVVAAHDVDLGFAQSGRVSRVYASVGTHVAAGTVLAEMDNGDLRAALSQKDAALKVQQAKLESLLNGTRPEELAVTESSIASDKAALAQARSAVVDAIQTAYTQSDDSVHNKLDQFFSSPRSQNPQITFITSDQQGELTLERDRLLAETMLADWGLAIASITPTSDLASSEKLALKNLAQISSMLLNANLALNTALSSNVGQSTIATYIKDVSTARANINSVSSALTASITAEAAAAATLDRDQKNLALQKAGSTVSDLDTQRAQVAAAAADVQNAQAQLEKTIIRAPFAGVITRMDAKVGEVMSPTSPQITMISDGLFQIECFIPEVEIAALSVGDSASTTLDAYGPSVTFGAKIVAIDPAETTVNGVSTYKTTLQFTSADPRIRKGMTASVLITSDEIPNALVVPQGAVFQKEGHATLKVIRDGKAIDVAVEKGAASSFGNVQIISGIKAGDQVVLNPTEAQ